MDPNACLERIDNALRDHEIGEAQAACDDLRCWLGRGGFAPDWDRFPRARDFYAGK